MLERKKIIILERKKIIILPKNSNEENIYRIY